MPSAKGKSVVSTEVPDELKIAIARRAAKEERSICAMVEGAILFYLKHAPVWKRKVEVPDPVRSAS